MFTGLIETMGEVSRVEPAGAGRRLEIAAPSLAHELAIGESVAINGVCLTVVDACEPRPVTTRVQAERGVSTPCEWIPELNARHIAFDVGPETLLRTNLGELVSGDRVNLERALRVSDGFGGHFVQGHVDGIGRIAERRRDGEWEIVWFSCPPELSAQMVPKGSVAVDGISLTLVNVNDDRFSVMLIPHTLENTTLGFKQPGAAVNLETDVLAKYVWKFVRQ
jgi:riboflavin synthase